MASFTHVHCSGKWDATANQWRHAVAALCDQGDVVTMTETTHHAPKARKGWRRIHFAEPGAYECSAYVDDRVWQAVEDYAAPISTTRYTLAAKVAKPTMHATVAVEQHRASGRQVAFAVIHFPSAVEAPISKDPKGRHPRFPRVRAYFEALRGIHATRKILREKHPGADYVLSADWNLDYHKRWVRAFVKARFPSLTVAWEHMPKAGTHGKRLIDFSMFNARLQTSGSRLLDRLPGFDHTPFATHYGFKAAPKQPPAAPAEVPATAQQVIAAAAGQVGYHEGRKGGEWDNVEKYAAEVPTLAWANGQPWCAVFVSWCFVQAKSLGILPGGPTASVAHIRDAARQAKRFSEYPAVGAVIIYGQNGDAHTGIVDSYTANTVTSTEGNAQPLTAKVLTPTGWKRMGELRVGDALIAPDGRPSGVTGVYPKGVRAVYRITLRDGSSTEACDEHLWRFHVTGCRDTVETTAQMKARVERGHRVNLPRLAPVEYLTTDVLPIDPYTLGVLIGDAYINPAGQARLTCADAEILHGLRERGYDVQEVTVGGESLPRAQEYRVNGVCAHLRTLGVAGKRSWEKRIPGAYLRASVKDRIDLLRGLMDTDGTVDSRGRMEFTSCSRDLAEDVQELVRSLGGRVAINVKTNVHYTSPNQPTRTLARDAYRVQNIRLAGIDPFTVTRKAERWHERTGSFGNNVVSVEYVRHDEVQCIAVSHPDRLYVTDDFIPTHNTNTNGSPEGDGVYRKVHQRRDPWVYGYSYPAYPEPIVSADPAWRNRK